jgi:hypothetical protein
MSSIYTSQMGELCPASYIELIWAFSGFVIVTHLPHIFILLIKEPVNIAL